MSEEDNSTGKLNFAQLPREKKCLLLFCIFSHFMSGLCTSLLAPFYPQEANKKGMSITLVGLTFSLFPLTIIITSPLFGYYMTQIGPKFLLLSGLPVGGICNILYGTLHKCPSGTLFIVSSIACRIMEAIGFSAYINAIMTIASKEFSANFGIVNAFIQTASEVGLMLGPVIGGALYEIGGFGTPFYVVGTLVILNGTFMFFVIPTLNTTDTTSMKNPPMLSLLCNPFVLISIASVLTGSLGISFLESTLANHMEPLGLSTGVIGLLFAICPCLFTVCSPIFGFLTDTKDIKEVLIVVGMLLFGFGFFLVGPAVIFPFLKLAIWTAVIGLVLIGGAFGCCLIPTIKCIIIGATESKWPDSMATYAVVMSINNTMYFSGAFAGPLVGSALIEERGYAFAYTAIGAWCMIMALINFIVFLWRYLNSTKSNNTNQLMYKEIS